MKKKFGFILLLVTAAAIRLVLFSVGLSDVFGRRVEIITPVTSLKRCMYFVRDREHENKRKEESKDEKKDEGKEM